VSINLYVEWDQLTISYSLGYSKKGWTNGEIGVEWIKEFDKATSAKADGQYRLLLVDGHNSHYTRGFLEYARTHKILVVCYPAHTTHVLQGLGVVVFAVLKRCLSDERDRFERETGQAISKMNFLAIYGRAHMRALTPATIISAFRKTGIHPFNRNAVPKEAMAPSKETSCEGCLPSVVAPEIQALAKLLQDMTLSAAGSEDGEGVEPAVSGAPEPDRTASGSVQEDIGGSARGEVNASYSQPASTISAPRNGNAMQNIVAYLSDGPLAYLVSSTPLTSTSRVPPSASQPIFETPPAYPSFEPCTSRERDILAALRLSEAREAALRHRLAEAQASNVINELYCTRLRRQLAYHEKKKENANKGKGRLLGDGQPCFLSGDNFWEKMTNLEAWLKGEEKRKEVARRVREDMAETLAEWKREEKARVKRNDERRERHKEAVALWEQERDAARASKQKFKKLKPRSETIEKPVPRPKPAEVIDENSDEDGDGEEDEDEDEDE
jgi:hypothetical protein